MRLNDSGTKNSVPARTLSGADADRWSDHRHEPLQAADLLDHANVLKLRRAGLPDRSAGLRGTVCEELK
jgi:hypothetical protein